MIKILFVQKFLQFQEFDVISKKNFSIDFLSTYVLLIQNRKIGQKFLSFENFENSRNSTSFPRILKIPRIWRHFQEKFFDRPSANICSADTKSQNWPNIFFIREFRKFQEFDVVFKNFKNSKNLTSFPRKISRSTSCQLMFFWYKIAKLAKNFFHLKISKIPGIRRHFQEF